MKKNGFCLPDFSVSGRAVIVRTPRQRAAKRLLFCHSQVNLYAGLLLHGCLTQQGTDSMPLSWATQRHFKLLSQGKLTLSSPTLASQPACRQNLMCSLSPISVFVGRVTQRTKSVEPSLLALTGMTFVRYSLIQTFSGRLKDECAHTQENTQLDIHGVLG